MMQAKWMHMPPALGGFLVTLATLLLILDSAACPARRFWRFTLPMPLTISGISAPRSETALLAVKENIASCEYKRLGPT
ncbi:hypothetical protein Mal15_67280 [Stieleria maiorica]|uniref:Uncharacterized protein n=1 Tax=Stieleria maiorica TaxID=2795974 RepID=A0A5B9MRC2_9BACT|nr:hypothetical protein Mal15_67280 [Stieleria maiorica]